MQRTTSSSIYVLDLEFPDPVRGRLARLTVELSASQELAPVATVHDIAGARERRSQLTAAMREINRQLEEAQRPRRRRQVTASICAASAAEASVAPEPMATRRS